MLDMGEWKETRVTRLLGLLRHAKSEWDDTAQRDFDRGLNDRGRRGAALIGEHIRSRGIRWEQLLASPAARVVQTLEHALPEMEPVFDERLYLASPETLVDVITGHAGESGAVLLVGHNPGLQELLLDLVAPARENAHFREASVKFPTASFAVLECRIDDWSALKNYCAEISHFARPRDLDPALGPQR
ncbi:MAG: histidine phosphatase family protein [Erythrobacter sp.]|jgi:phosphohistidine phosphatase|nr:histidine phosphatase family protein [Erythrobacter sp.]